MSNTNEPMSEPSSTEQSKSLPTPLLQSTELLQGHRVVLIKHAGEMYRLLVAKNDKLILQK